MWFILVRVTTRRTRKHGARGMAPEIEPVLWYDYIGTLWHEIGHTMCASHNRSETVIRVQKDRCVLG